VHRGAAAERIGPGAVAAGEASQVERDRQSGRNGSDALLQLLELLPACEELGEARIDVIGTGLDEGTADAVEGRRQAPRIEAELATTALV
jgi:hypothetical protein